MVSVWPESSMPIDANGNRADFIMDGNSTFNRMNPGRLHYHYLTGAMRDVSENVRKMFGLPHKQSESRAVSVHDINLINQAYEYLWNFYALVSPEMADLLKTYGDKERKRHVEKVIHKGVYIWRPPTSCKPITQVIRDVRDFYPQVHGPVQYRGYNGELITTVEPVFIASLYVMLLEKTGENWAAVASARLQHFGIPAKLTNEDKYSASGRLQPVRTMGESEVRTFLAVIGPEATAELMDQSNNPVVHKEVVRTQLIAKHPNTIESLVDRKAHPRGNGRPLVYLRHTFECGGIRLVRKKAA